MKRLFLSALLIALIPAMVYAVDKQVKVYDKNGVYYGVIPPIADLFELMALSKTSPVISPDGQTIAFITQNGSGTLVYIVPATGGTPIQIYASKDDKPSGLVMELCFNNLFRV
jgi:hypothetical protein